MKPLLILMLLLAGVAGAAIGWHLHPDPVWDIHDDPRACVIYWDDGTVSMKSKMVSLGNLAPGESKTVANTPPSADSGTR